MPEERSFKLFLQFLKLNYYANIEKLKANITFVD